MLAKRRKRRWTTQGDILVDGIVASGRFGLTERDNRQHSDGRFNPHYRTTLDRGIIIIDAIESRF